MKRLAVGLVLAAFAAAPAYAECSFNHMAMSKAKTTKPATLAKVEKPLEKKLDVASIPVDAWLIKYLKPEATS